METGDEGPRLDLAERVLPAPLLRAVRHVFAQRLSGCMLVGGTALAGFYAGHRRSDDIDLFTEGDPAQRAAVLAVRSLERLGASLEPRQESEVYFRALCRLGGHEFTVDVSAVGQVLRAGRAQAAGGVAVADLETLTMLKGAALLGRCAEKDLYDLRWLVENRPGLTVEGLVAAASRFDAGAEPENLLISVTGAEVAKERCGFGLGGASRDEVFRDVSQFKAALTKALLAMAKAEPAPPLAELLRRARRLRG